MLLCPPHDRDAGSTAPFALVGKTSAWRNRLFLLATGMSVFAIVLFSSRNFVAKAESASNPLPSPRLPRRNSLPAQQTMLWVNPQTGNDANGNGSEQAPFRTLTHALEKAQANTVIQLASGTYSTDTGEVFPIVLKSGVTVQGNPDELGSDVVIRGGGSYTSPSLGRQNATLIGASQAVLLGVTITNSTVRGYGLWVEAGNPTVRSNTFTGSSQTGLVAAGSSAPIVESNLFMLNRTSGLTVAGDARPAVQNNIFQRTGSGLVISEESAPQIISNRISQNRDGIVIQGNAQPVLRSNTIEDSDRNGLVVIAQAQPNLGTVADPGNNTFLNNRQHDIDALATSQTLPAYGNQLANTQVAGKVDLTGRAPLMEVTTVASVANHLPLNQTVSVATLGRSTNAAAQVPATPRPAVASTIQTAPSATLISSLPPTLRTVPASTVPAGTVPARTAPARTAPTEVKLAAARSPIEIPVPAPEVSSVRTASRQTAPAPVEINVPPPERPAAARQTSTTALLRPAAAPRPNSATQMARAIEISVPPPNRPDHSATGSTPVSVNSPPLTDVVVTAAASLPRQSFPASSIAPTLGGTPINIPVPPPAQPSAAKSNGSSAAANANTRILPVPAAEAPLGNTSGVERIRIANSTNASLFASPVNLQYRVVVAAEDEQTQASVQSIVPEAFVTVVDGRSVMQIGAFSSRDNAEEAVEMLSRNGFQGIIQPME